MILLSQDFESCASTNSATAAHGNFSTSGRFFQPETFIFGIFMV